MTSQRTDLISMDESTEDDHRTALTVDLAAGPARRSARARLRSKVAALIRSINSPLHAVVADHALPFLPPQSLHRLRSVSSDWNRRICSPIFGHTHSRTRRSPSGLFLPGPTFLPFDPRSDSIPDPTLSFLLHDGITVLSSSHGLLCCLALSWTYLVCNPSTRLWAPLPEPPADRPGVNYHAVLVFSPSAYNLDSNYFLVCPFEIQSVPGLHGFDVFSSESGAWRTSGEVCATEEIVAGSGVSAGGMACWRTTMQTVAIYDPAVDRARTVAWPAGYDQHVTWELAEIAGRLCCVVVNLSHVSVYTLGDGDRWGPRRGYLEWVTVGPEVTMAWRWVGREAGFGSEVWKGHPRPLRFQSGNLDALVAVGDEVYVLDLVRMRAKHVCSCATMAGCEGDVVAYVGTLAPVHLLAK